jgi:GNAT superfamily N-acetyltransferase
VNLNQISLPATDMAASVAFYRLLGCTLIVDALPRYARFECPQGEATFSLHPVDRPPQAPGVVVYLECDDLDAVVHRLQARGVAFTQAPRDEPWLWREARLNDPAGNALCLFHAGRHRRHPPWRLASADAAAHAEVRVRPWHEGDSVVALTALLHRAYAPLLAAGLNFTAADQDVDTTAARIAAGRCFVAEIQTPAGPRLVGSATVRGREPDSAAAAFRRPDIAIVNQLAVDPALQRRGIGQRLLQACEDWARQRGCTALGLDTAEPAEHLLRWYARQEFAHVETVQWPGKRYRSAVLVRVLED